MLGREGEIALRQLAEALPGEREDDPQRALLASLRAYLEAVKADPVTWRLVLMPPEGAPAVLRKQVTDGRDAVIDVLAASVASAGPGGGSPDPELTARLLSAVADEAARLLLTHPRRFPVDRLVDHAAWLLGRLGPE